MTLSTQELEQVRATFPDYPARLENGRIILSPPLSLPFTPHDLERVQATFDDYGMELRGGRIMIMSPCIVNCGGMASAIARSNFGFALMNWVKTGSDHPLGYVLGRCGWILPNGDVIEPDNCFIHAERMRDYMRQNGLTKLPESYPELVPDLVMECCCCTEAETDPSSYQKAKLQMLKAMGIPVGIFIEPEIEQTVTVYQQGQPEMVLRDGDILTIPELLPGWELPIAELWET